VTLCDDGTFEWGHTSCATKTEYAEWTEGDEKYDEDKAENLIFDENGNKIVVIGQTNYTTDDMVRSYLLDYPLLMTAAAEGYRELCDDLEDPEKSICEAEKDDASSVLDDAMSDMNIVAGGAPSDSTVSGTDQELAQKLLDYIADGTISTSNSPDPSVIKEGLQGTVDGNSDVDTKMLQFLVDLADNSGGKLFLNELATDGGTSANFDCRTTINYDTMDEIGRKYGIRTGHGGGEYTERCDSKYTPVNDDSLYRYSIKGNQI
jgi:hypothetical protein